MHLFVDIGQALATLFGFGGPSLHRSLKPQPERTHRPDWANADGSLGETLGLPSRVTWKKIHSSTCNNCVMVARNYALSGDGWSVPFHCMPPVVGNQFGAIGGQHPPKRALSLYALVSLVAEFDFPTMPIASGMVVRPPTKASDKPAA
jgi:hypothetical protein